MPKYYCDYCDTYLTHDSPSVRKTHCIGRKHRDNVKFYYQKWMEEQAQHLIDATTAAFKAGKIAQNPFSNPPPNMTAVPPPNTFGPPRMMPPPGKLPLNVLMVVFSFLFDPNAQSGIIENDSRYATNHATRYDARNATGSDAWSNSWSNATRCPWRTDAHAARDAGNATTNDGTTTTAQPRRPSR